MGTNYIHTLLHTRCTNTHTICCTWKFHTTSKHGKIMPNMQVFIFWSSKQAMPALNTKICYPSPPCHPFPKIKYSKPTPPLPLNSRWRESAQGPPWVWGGGSRARPPGKGRPPESQPCRVGLPSSDLRTLSLRTLWPPLHWKTTDHHSPSSPENSHGAASRGKENHRELVVHRTHCDDPLPKQYFLTPLLFIGFTCTDGTRTTAALEDGICLSHWQTKREQQLLIKMAASNDNSFFSFVPGRTLVLSLPLQGTLLRDMPPYQESPTAR